MDPVTESSSVFPVTAPAIILANAITREVLVVVLGLLPIDARHMP